MKEIIVIIIILLILSLSVFYIIKSKRNGNKCIGCPYANCQNKNNKSTCNCSKNAKNQKNT